MQSAITSPPYYGLRDYGTPPVVWGQTCCEHPHEWGEVLPPAWGLPGNKDLSTSGLTNPVGQFNQSRGRTSGQFCSHAHQWTTVIKPAANGIVNTAMQGDTLNGTSGTRKPASSSVCPCGAWLGSLGLEPTPGLYIEHLVEVFREVRRVLHDDGTLWVNLGDSYAGSGKGPSNSLQSEASQLNRRKRNGAQFANGQAPTSWLPVGAGLKPKDLMMMPARLAIALQADGWYLRSMIPWLKRNSMPESVTDRPATSVEYVFLLSKSRTYFWDADAVRSGYRPASVDRAKYVIDDIRSSVANEYRDGMQRHVGKNGGPTREHPEQNSAGRNRRNSDWFFESWQGLMLDEHDDPLALVVNPMPFKGSHFATFPPKLVEPMVKASTSEKGQCPECGAPWARVTEGTKYEPEIVPVGVRSVDASRGDKVRKLSGAEYNAQVRSTTVGWRASCAHSEASPVPQVVLDCFGGAGTVGLVADRLGRAAVLCELKPGYGDMATERLIGDAPMFVEMGA